MICFRRESRWRPHTGEKWQIGEQSEPPVAYEVHIVLRAINCSSQRATGPLFRRAHLNWLP